MELPTKEKGTPAGLLTDAVVVETEDVAPPTALETVEFDAEIELDDCVVVLDVAMPAAGTAAPPEAKEFRDSAAGPITAQPARDVVTKANAKRPAKATLNLSKRKPNC